MRNKLSLKFYRVFALIAELALMSCNNGQEVAISDPLYLSTGLPVVYITTENNAPIVSKEEWINASIQISNPHNEGVASSSCKIRGRGHSTWNLRPVSSTQTGRNIEKTKVALLNIPIVRKIWNIVKRPKKSSGNIGSKRPYLIKLDEKQSLFGMPEHKRWILLANLTDRTLMRNIVALKIAALTNLDYTPSAVPVELILNGKHVGNYLLAEQIRVHENRLNLPKDGYLLEADFHFDDLVQWIEPFGESKEIEGGIPFCIKWPDPDKTTSERINTIKAEVDTAFAALYGKDFKSPENGYNKYFDIDSFIDYWIVFEVTGNHELGNPGSVFIHKDASGKLKAGPCWDFDWGTFSYETSPHARNNLINKDAIWYNRFFQDPYFIVQLRNRYNELLPSLEQIPTFIDTLETSLAISADLNFTITNPAGVNGDENLSYHEAVVRLKEIYQERLQIIRQQLSEL